MKITVINATEKHGVTYKLKEVFLEEFRGDAEITEFYLPKDCPEFCTGCTTCFLRDEHQCKDAEYVQRIEKSLRNADLLVFASPAYVFHATGAMKSMLDHFGYRWMPHRPAREMFGKRAVIITQCLGAGGKSAAKDIKHSLSWWGISSIRTCSFKLMSDVQWTKIPEKKRAVMTAKLQRLAKEMHAVDYSKPAATSLTTKAKFLIIRKMQAGLGKQDPEYTDFKYWKANGWLDKARPWKEYPYIDRIKYYEGLLEQAEEMLGASTAAGTASAAADASVDGAGNEEVRAKEFDTVFRELEAYYGSDDWKADFAADEAGRLPAGMKRGVLSEDGIYNVLERRRERS